MTLSQYQPLAFMVTLTVCTFALLGADALFGRDPGVIAYWYHGLGFCVGWLCRSV